MRFKDFAIKEAAEDGGGFTGYAATFDREPDSYGDVIAPGAFTESLRKWAEAGKPVPLLYGHNMEDPDYNIGFADLSEDETGLLTEGHFDSSPKAQRVRQLVREGRLYKMSFAYEVLDEAPVELEDGTKANELRQLEIYEVSVVLVPANRHAEILEAKARSKYGAAISKANGDELRRALDELESIRDSASEAIGIIEPLIPDSVGDGGDEAGDESGDEDGSGEGGDANRDAAKSRAAADRLRKLINA